MMHCMLDLETLGTNPGCIILSIGACRWNPEQKQITLRPRDKFYRNVNIQSCLDAGLTADGATIAWWLDQSHEARAALRIPEPGDLSLALLQFQNFYEAWGEVPELRCRRLWCHGATFDVPVLGAAYRTLDKKEPWGYRDVRDTRTLFELTGVIIDRTAGIHHHALHDAIAQAEAVHQALRKCQQVSLAT